VRRLGGRRWKRLHMLVYVIAPLGVTHHWMMVKKDVTEPAIHALILALLLGWRVAARLRHNARVSHSRAASCIQPQSSSSSSS
jgi:methionine sulfoxide reductase heme-binding subunit